MQVFDLSVNHSLLQEFVKQLRDVELQKDRMRFRKNVERIGQIMAYELSKHLPYKQVTTQTPLGISSGFVMAQQPVLATILRAGLSMHNGFMAFFDEADCAFVSAYRKHDDKGEFEIKVEYLASPNLNQRTLILIDPMLATGQSIALSYQALLQNGAPLCVHVVCLIASQQGIQYLKQKLPNATLWVACVDDDLNNHGYIIPGLGDAGDLCFGEKLER